MQLKGSSVWRRSLRRRLRLRYNILKVSPPLPPSLLPLCFLSYSSLVSQTLLRKHCLYIYSAHFEASLLKVAVNIPGTKTNSRITLCRGLLRAVDKWELMSYSGKGEVIKTSFSDPGCPHPKQIFPLKFDNFFPINACLTYANRTQEIQ